MRFLKFTVVHLIGLLIVGNLIGCGDQNVQNQQPGRTSVQTEKEDRLFQPFRKWGGDFTRATDLYGPAVVREGKWISDTKFKPWSAYWMPYSDDYLYRDPSSPLQKYDLYLNHTRGAVGLATETELKARSEAELSSWSGRSDAWALAALMEPEPRLKKPVELAGVVFSEQDLKALLILTYERVDHVIQFGQQFRGDDESVHADIYPEQFHRVIQKMIFEEKRPLIMDREMGIEVKNVPIFQAEADVHKEPADPNVLHVKTVLDSTLPLSSPDSFIRGNQRNVIYEYTYDLYGYPQRDGSFKVAYGVWTGDSIRHHPDYLWALPVRKDRKSKNEKIDVKVVEEIVRSALEKSRSF